MTNSSFLTMNHIEKSFSGVPVLKDVSLHVAEGEIHALLGENGAGKSTLMNILGGIHRSEKGSIFMSGQEVKITDPRTAQQYGISFIHQELNVVSDLKVYENIFLGTELCNKFGFLEVEEMCKQTSAITAQLGVTINPKEYVRNLDASYKQLVEISRALLHNAKLIIMDEPTSALAEHEVEQYFILMKKLKASGVSIIYISHKLNEIKQICDRYTVLRDGEVVGTGLIQEDNLNTITKLMVGKPIIEDRYMHTHELGPVILEVENLTSDGLFTDVNFKVRKGEIHGFTGLAGDGRTELFESIFGYRKKYTGNIKVNQKKLKIDHPKKALNARIGFVPKDRKETAIIKDLSVLHNMSLASISHFEKYGFINNQLEEAQFETYKQQLNIKVHDPDITIDKLSGGNQQKVMIAKWLEVDTDILIFDNPTQGIDVGAKREIYQHIVALAKKGKGIIILSSEASEILKISHSIHVMAQGKIVAQLKAEKTSEAQIMRYATGSYGEGVTSDQS